MLALCPDSDISRQLVASMRRWTPVSALPAASVSVASSRIRRLFHRERPAHQEVAIA